MSEKVTGTCAGILREASGQISGLYYERLLRKCLYKEIVPEILAGTRKSARKNTKNSAIASFHGEESAHQVSKQDMERFSPKEFPNIDQNWAFTLVLM